MTTDAAPPENLKCPHCLVACLMPRPVRDWPLGHDSDGHWWCESRLCPNCGKVVAWLAHSEALAVDRSGIQRPHGWQQWSLVRPKASGRPPVPPEVPEEFAEDYMEACLVIADSPKASAALSRRCLQHILREKAQVQDPDNLARAIQEVVNNASLPSDISSSLDAVRNIGNFSAHPNKSVNTGTIVDVEPGEAEWCLEVIEILFDHYFVRPADIQRRRQAVDNKLVDTGKPPMVAPPPSV